jgi:Zn-dependent metalloprotease
MTAPRSLLLALALLACSQEPQAPRSEDLFQNGDPEELLLAQEMAYGELYAAKGPATLKGVEDLEVMRSRVDDLNMAHVRVQQTLGGVPVWGGEAIVHFHSDGRLFSITDSLLEAVQVDTTPAYSAEEAMDLAVEASPVGWDRLTDEPEVDLWVFRDKVGGDHLAWRVALRSVEEVSQPTMPVIFVDAHTGEQLWQYENLQTATCNGNTNFYGSVSFECYIEGSSYKAWDEVGGVSVKSYNNTTTTLSEVTSTSATFSGNYRVTNAVEAHYVAGKTISYYAATFGRDGIDGAGGPAAFTLNGLGYIGSTTSYSNNYVNAFWDGVKMTYGDGDGVNSRSLTTLDVGGHEFTHGVTEHEANLTYSGEPGHLNEAYSDIFGAMVERNILGESADTWLIGEDTWTPGTAGDALRYMNDPADDGYSTDYYTSGIGSVDVHYGSGVPNLAFYLLSEGGTHPRGKSTVNTVAIGADDAAAIYYLALTDYMTSSTNFSGARTAHINAATALFGASSQQVASVKDSWAAVGVGAPSTMTCTTTTYSGSLSRSRTSGYAPSSSGLSASAGGMQVDLTGPSGADFDLYLEVKSGSKWKSVASSAGATSTESLYYTAPAGTYRVRVYSYSGTGSYSVNWCR